MDYILLTWTSWDLTLLPRLAAWRSRAAAVGPAVGPDVRDVFEVPNLKAQVTHGNIRRAMEHPWRTHRNSWIFMSLLQFWWRRMLQHINLKKLNAFHTGSYIIFTWILDPIWKGFQATFFLRIAWVSKTSLWKSHLQTLGKQSIKISLHEDFQSLAVSIAQQNSALVADRKTFDNRCNVCSEINLYKKGA